VQVGIKIRALPTTFTETRKQCKLQPVIMINGRTDYKPLLSLIFIYIKFSQPDNLTTYTTCLYVQSTW